MCIDKSGHTISGIKGGVITKRFLLFSMVLLLFVACAQHQKKPVQPNRTESEAAVRTKKEQSAPSTPKFILKYSDRKWELDLSLIGYDGVNPNSLDREAFFDWLSGVEREVNRPPKSARFQDHAVQPHEYGRKVDRTVIEQWLDNIPVYVNQPLDVPVEEWKPPVTTEMLQRIEEKRLATYTTYFDPELVNRTRNIELSARAIDRYVVPVGEVFSFNEAVGPRTSERGYLPAPVIVEGEYTEGIGGGICQTSSTLFNSVDRAGLKIIERVSHSKQVTYVPAGRDATVSWGGPDFKFQNQLNGPILITAQTENGKLTVEVYASSDVQHTLRSVPEPLQKLPETEKVPDPDERQPLNERRTEYKEDPLPTEDLEQNNSDTKEGLSQNILRLAISGGISNGNGCLYMHTIRKARRIYEI